MKLYWWILIIFFCTIFSNIMVDWAIGNGLNLDRGINYYAIALGIAIIIGIATHKILKVDKAFREESES